MEANRLSLALELFITASRFSRSAARVPVLKHPGVVWRVLSTLSNQGPLRSSQIAASERISQSSITTTVDRMERLGLVTRAPDEADGRATRIHLTDQGREELQNRRRLIVDRFDSYFSELSDLDAAVLERSIGIMHDLYEIAELAADSELRESNLKD